MIDNGFGAVRPVKEKWIPTVSCFLEDIMVCVARRLIGHRACLVGQYVDARNSVKAVQHQRIRDGAAGHDPDSVMQALKAWDFVPVFSGHLVDHPSEGFDKVELFRRCPVK